MQPEARLRARCRMFLQSHLVPPCWFTAIEHGRKHAGTAEQRAREWQHLQSQGVKQGIGDLLILAPGYCCFIELKAGKNTQSEAQHAFQAVLAALGHGYSVCRSVESLGHQLTAMGVPLALGWQIAAMHHDAALDVPTKGHNKPPRTSRPRAAKPTLKQVAQANRLMLGMAGR